MADVPTLFNQVPAGAWTALVALVASILTLTGTLLTVWLTNRGSNKRLTIQLEHDAREKVKERTATLRKEVYLQAAEEVVKAQTLIGSYAGQDPGAVDLGMGLQNFFGVAAKLQLVAEPQTALLANKLLAFYGELMLKIMARLIPIKNAKMAIETADQLAQDALRQMDRVQRQIIHITESGQRDDAALNALRSSFKLFEAQAEKHLKEKLSNVSSLALLLVEFARFVLPETEALQKVQNPLMLEIRKDMGLGSIETFERQAEEQFKRLASQTSKLLDSLEKSSHDLSTKL